MRLTVSINPEIYGILRTLQGTLITSTKEDWSFTTVLNTVVLAGIISLAYGKLDENQLNIVKLFLDNQKVVLETDGTADQLTDEYIRKLLSSKS